MLERGEHLTLSTAHLTDFDASRIGDLGGVFTKGDYGFYVHTNAVTFGPHTVFTSLRECVYFARRHDFSFLILDRDGPTIDELPTYDW